MKTYKKIMNVITMIEAVVLALATLLVLVLTFINVFARYLFHHSMGFTEEIAIAVFVLISLLAAGVASRTGELVNLGLLPDHVGPKGKKGLCVVSSFVCVVYAALLAWQGLGRIQVDHSLTPILHIDNRIFWSFVVIGGISLVLHFIENCIDFCTQNRTEKEK